MSLKFPYLLQYKKSCSDIVFVLCTTSFFCVGFSSFIFAKGLDTLRLENMSTKPDKKDLKNEANSLLINFDISPNSKSKKIAAMRQPRSF